MRTNYLRFSLNQSLVTLVLAALSFASQAQERGTPPHSSTTIPPSARYEIVQSQLAAKWTFRLDRVCGQVTQLVKSKDDDVTWENMGVIGLPKCVVDGKPRYQLFSSALAARHTFLINLDNGRTWVLTSFKDEKLVEVAVWAPFAE
jgi:hypothetical protein